MPRRTLTPEHIENCRYLVATLMGRLCPGYASTAIHKYDHYCCICGQRIRGPWHYWEHSDDRVAQELMTRAMESAG
jgi:elongation factor P hydroxylase